MTVPRACTKSAVRCGREVWPPGEVRRSSSRSAAAVMGPMRVPTRPTASRGSQCRPKIRSTPSRPPAAMTSSAPPGVASSAGWKMNLTRPGSCGALAIATAAPSRDVVCTSWPHAWQTPSTVDRNSRSVASVTGRASRSARSATQVSPSPTSQVRPVPPGSTTGRRPTERSVAATRSVVAYSRRDSSGCAWMCRRQAMRSPMLPSSHSSNQDGPRPAPRSSTPDILTPSSEISTPPDSVATPAAPTAPVPSGRSGRASTTVTPVLLATTARHATAELTRLITLRRGCHRPTAADHSHHIVGRATTHRSPCWRTSCRTRSRAIDRTSDHPIAGTDHAPSGDRRSASLNSPTPAGARHPAHGIPRNPGRTPVSSWRSADSCSAGCACPSPCDRSTRSRAARCRSHR